MAEILNQKPTRREQIQQKIATIDPMVNLFDSEIQETKRNQYYYLWDQLEDFAHHKSNADIADFNKYLREMENTVFDLLASVTAQDPREIQTILKLQHGADVLGKTDTLKGWSERLRKKKFTSTPMRTFMKPETELGILSHRYITRNALILH